MVLSRDPTCDNRSIMRMFKLCGSENESGEHEIQVVRMHYYLVYMLIELAWVV